MHEKIIQMMFLLAMEIFLILTAINFFLITVLLIKMDISGYLVHQDPFYNCEDQNFNIFISQL
jgi:hypothetical protein